MCERRHRDHYMAVAAVLDDRRRPDYLEYLNRIAGEMDNLRAAFAWSLEAGDTDGALRLASSLFPCGRTAAGTGRAWRG